MSSDQTHSAKHSEADPSQPKDSHPTDYAPYPKLDPNDVAPPQENWTSVSMFQQPVNAPTAPEVRAPISGDAATTMPSESNPYVSPAPATAPPSSAKSEYSNP